MTEQIIIDPSNHAASGSKDTADLNSAIHRPTHVYAIPKSQLYYWTEQWQVGERETLAALSENQGMRFTSGKTFSDWLLSDDDEAASPTDGD